MADIWTCPTCGKKYPTDVIMCWNCRTPSMIKPGGLPGVSRPLKRSKSEATIRITPPQAKEPEPEPPPPPSSPPDPESRVEVRYPYVLKDIRYNVPCITGDVWTDGSIVAIEQGLYLISTQDDLDPKEMGHQPLPPDGHLARLSLFVSTGAIVRVSHKDPASPAFIEALRGRIPLDLSEEARQELDIICRGLQITRS